VVLGEHKLQGLLRTAIIGLESLLHAHIRAGDSATLELDHADEPVVDDADELRLDALVDGNDATDGSFRKRRYAQMYNWCKAVPALVLPFLMTVSAAGKSFLLHGNQEN